MEQLFEDDSQVEQQLTPTFSTSVPEIMIRKENPLQKEIVRLDPPRQLPTRSYSLEPDMVNGWKPKNSSRINFSNVFSINYQSQIVDQIVRELYKRKEKNKERLVYLGPRKNNSYILHENRSYANPYPVDKKLNQLFSGRRGLPQQPLVNNCQFKFDSDFQCGNLDVAVQRGDYQYDLFMRVDSNTKGHTNWYYFSVQNGDFIGSVRFNLCNFRRQKSLYQRGLRPYVYSKLIDTQWHQGGKNVLYERKRPKYDFLYEDSDSENQNILNTYFTMSFTYDFLQKDDTVYFAYCVPYTYTRLIKFLGKIKYAKKIEPLKTLSGLYVPVLEITDEKEPEYNKQIVLVTGRIHPGQSNSSFMAEGFMDYLCSSDSVAKQIRKKYIFYMVPMLNPDGVVAGNYRTSLFGKDLNRTFDQSRKYAFPQTFHLVELAKDLKERHKKRFTLYIDLHGHSVKKNVFMYGPQFSIQHPNYEISKQLPKILGSMTSLFRYYSCIFRISGEKVTTARAIMNRRIDVPFTYTTEASNGFYIDPSSKAQMPFTSKKFREMGVYLCKSFSLLKFDQNFKIKKTMIQKISKDDYLENQKNSDDEISEGGSDSEPQGEDLQEKQLKIIQALIEGKKEEQHKIKQNISSPTKLSMIKKFESEQLKHRERAVLFLPPINTLNRAVIFSNRSKKKQTLRNERLINIQSPQRRLCSPPKPRYSKSQMMQMMNQNHSRQLRRPSNLRHQMQSYGISKLRMSKQ